MGGQVPDRRRVGVLVAGGGSRGLHGCASELLEVPRVMLQSKEELQRQAYVVQLLGGVRGSCPVPAHARARAGPFEMSPPSSCHSSVNRGGRERYSVGWLRV